MRPVVTDEARIPDLHVGRLRRLQPKHLDGRSGIVLEGTTLDEAAVAAVFEVDAALVVVAGVRHVAERAVADDEPQVFLEKRDNSE